MWTRQHIGTRWRWTDRALSDGLGSMSWFCYDKLSGLQELATDNKTVKSTSCFEDRIVDSAIHRPVSIGWENVIFYVLVLASRLPRIRLCSHLELVLCETEFEWLHRKQQYMNGAICTIIFQSIIWTLLSDWRPRWMKDKFWIMIKHRHK
jgi:hypothetical protein